MISIIIKDYSYKKYVSAKRYIPCKNGFQLEFLMYQDGVQMKDYCPIHGVFINCNNCHKYVNGNCQDVPLTVSTEFFLCDLLDAYNYGMYQIETVDYSNNTKIVKKVDKRFYK